MASRKRSAMTRVRDGSTPREASQRSTAKIVMPIDPNGTSPISTLRPETSRTQRPGAHADREERQEPGHERLVAAQHVARERRDRGEEDRAEEPQPRDAEQRMEHRLVARGDPEVAPGLREGFQLIATRGSGRASVDECAATRPATATARHAAQRTPARRPHLTSRPPAMVPTRIATKVPISTRPLPPVSRRPSGAAAGTRT